MSAASEITRFFPRPGRTPPPRLRVVPSPFEDERTACARPTTGATWEDILRMRGELPTSPAPARGPKRAARPANRVPPYLQPRYWRGEVKLGHQLHDAMREEMAREAKIRACPRSLAALLATPEWRGSAVTEPDPHELENLRRQCGAALAEAEHGLSAAKTRGEKRRLTDLFDARAARMARLQEAVKVTHPSGAVILWLPTAQD